MIGTMRTEGSRADLVAKLHGIAEGCLGSDTLREAAHDGAELLQGGETTSIRVGHTEYVVTDDE